MQAYKQDLQRLMLAFSSHKHNNVYINNAYITNPLFNHDFEAIACEVFGVKHSDIKTPKRARDLVWCRFMIVGYLRENTKYNYHQIGKKYNRDHSTIIYAFNQHNNLLNDSLYKMYYADFEELINNQ